jgi:hypothetical protein
MYVPIKNYQGLVICFNRKKKMSMYIHVIQSTPIYGHKVILTMFSNENRRFSAERW